MLSGRGPRSSVARAGAAVAPRPRRRRRRCGSAEVDTPRRRAAPRGCGGRARRRAAARQVLGQRVQLEDHRARVGLVGDQQVDDRQHLQGRAVAAAVGHRAVGDVEHRLQQRRPRARRRRVSAARATSAVFSARSSRRPMSRNRQAASRVMLSEVKPASAARIMIERSRRAPSTSSGSSARPALAFAELVLQRDHERPAVHREAIAHRAADPIDGAHRRAQRPRVRRRRTARPASAAARRPPRPPVGRLPARGPRGDWVCASSAATSGTRVVGERAPTAIGEAQADHPRQPRDRFGALGVAPQPEEVVGDPARQIAAAARQLDRLRAAGGSSENLLTAPSLITQVSLLRGAALHRDVALGRCCRRDHASAPGIVW